MLQKALIDYHLQKKRLGLDYLDYAAELTSRKKPLGGKKRKTKKRKHRKTHSRK
jgi:hypothetical protein